MISRSKLWRFLLIFFIISFNTSLIHTSYYNGHGCKGNTYDPNNSTYAANLNILFSALSSNASLAATTMGGFYNDSAGSMVYGLFLCRADMTPDLCSECVATATKDIRNYCTNQTTGVIWYDECLLRYSDDPSYWMIDQDFWMYMCVQANATDVGNFKRVLNDLMIEIANETSYGSGKKKYAVRGNNYSTFQRPLNTFAQCAPDLRSIDCLNCLRWTISQIPICGDSQGGRFLTPRCNIRYDLYQWQWYNFVSPAPESSPNERGPPPSPTSSKNAGGVSTWRIVVVVAAIIVVIVLFIGGFCFTRRSRNRYAAINEKTRASEISTPKSLQYNLGEIQDATRNFAIGNRIGEGGFGPVYKGTFPNGQEIAVKRLSRGSAQGTEEFKNEITLVARLQHRNLVRLLGFCFEGEERILIYEFVKNKSLDYFLFDPEKQNQLDWSRRVKIIGGIARGLLYLHEDSQLKIIHRDLKASNVLLDENMNPKIADFGMARLFEVDQSKDSYGLHYMFHNRNYGYMAPEYAIQGLISVKSDVFSFGVLVLEIISGKKNSHFYQANGDSDLLSYAWKQWRNGTPLAIVDPTVGETYARNEVLRCIHVGLLCIQDEVEERPSMASVVLMFNSTHSFTLPTPKLPPYLNHSGAPILPYNQLQESETATANTQSIPRQSVNEVSVTELYPR